MAMFWVFILRSLTPVCTPLLNMLFNMHTITQVLIMGEYSWAWLVFIIDTVGGSTWKFFMFYPAYFSAL